MREISLKLGSISSEIKIKKGMLKDAGTEIKKYVEGRNAAIITDENVFSLYGSSLKDSLHSEGIAADYIVVKPGEQSKSVDTLKKVYSELVSLNITRGDFIIALGGGVVGDLAGFAASTYLRGVDFVQIPTSLLAQIDSSIGGKVAVDLDEGKNLVGSFYHPKLVLIDPELLNTLNDRFIKDGLGEAVKYGCISDIGLFESLMNMKSREQLFNNIEDIIYRCLLIKKETVETDEKDKGLRMTLNFGHTFGHAIEKYFNYEKYSHGEAVSMGMYHITSKSEVLGYTEIGTAEKIREVLENLGIEYRMPEMAGEEVENAILLDKKNISGNLNLILLRKIGTCFIEKIPVASLNKFI